MGASDRYNVSSVLDANLAAGRGERIAIRFGDARLSYRDLAERVNRAGNALEALGVRRGDRLLVVLDDTPTFPAAFLGGIRVGAVPVPVNPLLRGEDLRFFAEDSGARVAVVDLEFVDKARPALLEGAGIPIVVANGTVPDLAAFDDLLNAAAPDLSPADTRGDDIAFLLYSSGSTGKPKGVVHLQRDIPHTCETYAARVLGIRPDDVAYSTSKMFHAYGLGNSLTFPLSAGASSVVVPGRPSPEAALRAIRRHRPTLFFSVPTLYNAILHDPGLPTADLSSIRLCVSAAEALPAGIWRRWKEATGLTILDGIGTTEMLHIFVSNVPDAVRPGSSGRIVPGYEARIVDDDGRPVPPGEAGHLLVRGDSAAPNYWNRPDRTATTMTGGWIRTGDRYRIDEDGYFWHEGRADDMIKVGGMWVSPVEVEAVLIEHPAVREAAVVGIRVEGLNRMKAHVVLREAGAGTPDLVADLQRWCKDRLQRYEYPHVIEFVGELPKTATGKVLRYRLREGDGEAAGASRRDVT